jgi:hypothetical protein
LWFGSTYHIRGATLLKHEAGIIILFEDCLETPITQSGVARRHRMFRRWLEENFEDQDNKKIKTGSEAPASMKDTDVA